jgi:4-hydroxybenzoate polyprenyltransferase
MALAAGVTWVFYNPTATAVIGIAEVLAIVYCLFLRDHVGYLSLPFVIALFPIGGWAAISPETLFSSRLPWLLGGIVLTWQSAHIMVYSPAHPISDENGVLRCEKKALFFFPTPRQAAMLGLFFAFLLFVESLLLPVMMKLGVFYWFLALPAGLLTVGTAIWLLLDPMQQRRAIFAFNAASQFLAFLCGGVVLDVIFSKHLGSFLSWGISIANDLIAMVERGSVTVEKSIYVIGLVVTIAVAVLSAGGMLRAIVRTKGA